MNYRGINKPVPNQRNVNQRPFRRNEQRGIYARSIPDTTGRYRAVEAITRRHWALQAGLPAPEQVPAEFRGLGNKNLPIDAKRQSITAMIRDSKVSMLEGQTGSGKTSQLWQYLLGEGYDLTIVIVPRIGIAENVYERAREELTEQRSEALADETLGVMNSEHVVRGENTKVLFMTAGTFTKIFSDFEEEYGDKPVAIVSDEIHEADLQVELATAIAAQSMQNHDAWRLVLSSATHDKEKAQRVMTPVNDGPVPIVSVEGRPNTITFIEEPELTPIQALYKYARLQMELDDEEAPWTGPAREKIMTFVPGKREANEMLDDIYATLDTPEGRASGLAAGFNPMLYHSKVSRSAMARVMQPAQPGSHDVIASTSAGQSGITIPGLSLVITDGLTKRSELDEEASPGLFVRNASKAEITQQGGRAGRDVANGICVLARSKDALGEEYFLPISEREEHAPPQIVHTNIMRTVLTVAALDRDFGELNEFLMNGVDEQTILEAQEGLYRLGAIDRRNKVTQLGKDMDLLPMRPELARAVVEAWRGGYSTQTIAHVTAAASAFELGGFASFEDGSHDAWKALLRETTADDVVAQIDMFYATREAFFGKSVDEELLMSQDIDAKNAYKIHRQWDKSMRAMGLSPEDIVFMPPRVEDEAEIRDIMLAGMVDYVYQKTGVTGYRNDPVYQSIHRHLTDTPRTISSRSLSASDSPVYVAGFPRRYPTIVKERVDKNEHEKGTPKFAKREEIKHVVDSAWPLTDASRQKLAEYSAHLITSKTVDRRVGADGRLEVVRQRRLGAMVLAQEQARVVAPPNHTERELLVSATLAKHDTDVQRTLRHLLHELDELRSRILSDEYGKYFNRVDFPHRGSLKKWVETAAKHAHSVGEVNENLRTRLYLDDTLSIDTWISSEARAEIYEKSPATFEGNGRLFTLRYDNGRPFIPHMKPENIDQLPRDCRLPDGREIMFRVESTQRSDRQFYTLQELQAMRRGSE